MSTVTPLKVVNNCVAGPRERRYVVVNGVNSFGAEIAATIVQSPFLLPTLQCPQVVLLDVPHLNTPESMTVRLQDIDEVLKFESEHGTLSNTSQLSIAGVRGVSHPLVKESVSYTHVPESDVYVYVASSADPLAKHLDCIAYIAKVTPPSQDGQLILIAPQSCFDDVAKVIHEDKRFKSWYITVVWVPQFAPRLRGLRSHSFLSSSSVLQGALECACLGVVTGVVRHIPINPSQDIPIIPFDLPLHSAILAFDSLRSGSLPASLTNPKHVMISVSSADDDVPRWGMVAEYVMDYLGRYMEDIRRVFPAPELLVSNPQLSTSGSFTDAMKYSVSLLDPLSLGDATASRRLSKLMSRYPQSTTTQRMNEAFQKMNATLSEVVSTARSRNRLSQGAGVIETMRMMASSKRRSPGPSGVFSVESGSTLHTRLQNFVIAQPKLLPHVALMSPRFMEWDLYMKHVCVATIQYVNKFFLRGTDWLHLPVPTPIYWNDLMFHGDGRAPDSELWPRRWFPDLHWYSRVGRTHSKPSIDLAPGMTGERLRIIMSKPHIQEIMKKVAKDRSTSMEAVEKRTEATLIQIGDTLNERAIRTFGYMVKRTFFQLFDQIQMTAESCHILHQVMKRPRTQIVIVPTHRSYMDFLVVTYVLTVMALPLPHICAGEDFLRMGALAPFMRGSGAFFMRRSFRDDKLYSALFREYVKQLVVHNQPVEFFIEGTRSRTGKTLPPRLGILKFITDAYFSGMNDIDDVLFVPISLSYDELLEKNVYGKEMLGVPKPKETLGNLLKATSILNRRYGAMNINVAAPISLRELTQSPDAFPSQYTPTAALLSQGKPVQTPQSGSGQEPVKTRPNASPTPPVVLTRMAWHITHALQRNLVVAPAALVAATLQGMIGVKEAESGVTLSDLASLVSWVRSAVATRKGVMNQEYESLESVELTRKGVYHLQPQVQRGGEDGSGILKDMVRCDTSVLSQIIITTFTNQLMHLFIDEAIIVVVALALDKPSKATAPPVPAEANMIENPSNSAQPYSTVPMATLVEACEWLRTALQEEFPNYSTWSPIPFKVWFYHTLQQLQQGGVVYTTSKGTKLIDATEITVRSCRLTTFLSQLLYPYVESLFLTAATVTAVAAAGRESVSENDLLRVAQKGFEVLHGTTAEDDGNRLIDYAQVCSRELLKSSTAALEKEGTLRKEKTTQVVYNVLVSGQEATSKSKLLNKINRFRQHVAIPKNLETVVEHLKTTLSLPTPVAKSNL